MAMASIGAADVSSSEQSCMARTLYFEARTQGREGMVAVGWVILNRMHDKEFPDTVCGVVKQGKQRPGCQFSIWCDGKPETPKNDDDWALAQTVATQMLSNPPADPTSGAMYYHTVDRVPAWAAEHTGTARIGRHVYYR